MLETLSDLPYALQSLHSSVIRDEGLTALNDAAIFYYSMLMYASKTL